MALGTFAVGEYTATFDGTTLGMCTSGGKNLFYRLQGQLIDDTDTYGRTPIDLIELGAEVFLRMTFREWLAKVKLAIWPLSTAWDGILGTIGRLGTAQAKQIVLTAKAGTPAADGAVGPATITFPSCHLAEGQDVNVLFAPAVRDVPVVFRVFPTDVSGTIRFWTQT